MCGLVAIYAFGSDAPPIDRRELVRIRDAMRSRGPDGEGDWVSADGRVGLGHRRLAIVDLTPSGAQPMHTADGRLHIVFNGEIYNYRDLRAELQQAGVPFRSSSDTEVILHLYRRYGAGAVARLRGMFALALWDDERRGLLLARDPLGIKPLYYARDEGTIRVASQVKALRAGGSAGTRVSPAGHVGFHLWGHVPEPYTLFDDIRSLPAGHLLWIGEDEPGEPEEWFSLRDVLIEAGAHPDPESSWRPRLGGALRDSVKHHMIADVPVGIFLSSGLDSSTITALAAECSNAPLATYTLGFDEYRGTTMDEAPLAQEVAATYDTRHATDRISKNAFAESFDDLMAAMDQPTVDGVNVYFVSKAVARSGLKVALSGLGGDELFGGYDSFRQIPGLVRALKPLRPYPAVGRAFRWLSAPLVSRFTSPKYASLFELGTEPGGAYLLRRGLFLPWELPHFLDADLVAAGWRELHLLARLRATIDGLPSLHAGIAALETCWFMRNQLLRDSDWAGMAHSLEIRTPLVDAELYRALAPALCGTAPPGKKDLASSPARPLPESVLNRKKTGFEIPVREWIMARFPADETKSQAESRRLRRWARIVHAAQAA